jgi:hypothetical protein
MMAIAKIDVRIPTETRKILNIKTLSRAFLEQDV